METCSHVQIGKKRKHCVDAEDGETSLAAAETDCEGEVKKKDILTDKTDRKVLDEVNGRQVMDDDFCCAESLSDAQLDLAVSIKQLAMERSISKGFKRSESSLPATALRPVGIILEELIKDCARKLILKRESNIQIGCKDQEQHLMQNDNSCQNP